jgi:hypothetical protein
MTNKETNDKQTNYIAMDAAIGGWNGYPTYVLQSSLGDRQSYSIW